MNHVIAAEILLTCLCAIQGLATLAIDFNRTHATNALWPGHARFHVVWQSNNTALLSVLEIALIWLQLPYRKERFFLALLLTAISPAGFLLTCAARKIFGGTLSDPNGIPPAKFVLFGVPLSLDLNLAAVVAALLSLAVIWASY